MDYVETARWSYSSLDFIFDRDGSNTGVPSGWPRKLPWRYKDPKPVPFDKLFSTATKTGRLSSGNRSANTWSARQMSKGLGIPREYLGFPPAETVFPMTALENMTRGFPFRGCPLCLDGLRC